MVEAKLGLFVSAGTTLEEEEEALYDDVPNTVTPSIISVEPLDPSDPPTPSFSINDDDE